MPLKFYLPVPSATIKQVLFCILICLSFTAYAQPANDNCTNAEVINIPGNGYGTGTFTSSNVNITQATVQPGETFAPAVLVAGQNQKSIWFKFTLPTTRSIRVTLQQPSAVIQAGDAGFGVYKTNTCLPAGTNESLKLTPLATFGNTYHPCVDSGVYLVQVSSKAATAGLLSIQIECNYSVGALYDKPTDAYAFGPLTAFTSHIDFPVECQSLDDDNEVCTVLSNYRQYTKSTWHTFKTPAYFDYLSVLVASPTGSFTGGQQVFGYKLYKGDARTMAVTSLTPVSGCDSLKTSGYYPDFKIYKCGELDNSTTYTVQLFYKQNFIQDVRLAVAYGGVVATKAPEPILSSMAASNQLGVLAASPAGITTNASDYLACNSRHILHPCGDALPVSGIVFSGNRYNLSTFYTFTLAAAANIYTTAYSSTCNNPTLLTRLYSQNVNNNCATLVNTALSGSALTTLSLDCLPAGTYTIQISGRDTALPATSFYYGNLGSSSPLCMLSNLGQKVDFSIRVNTVQALNRFALQNTGAYDKINNSTALQNGITYQAAADTFGCSATVLPDTICTTSLNKASYRQFVISDSGVIGVSNLNYYFQYKLYKGDADALSTQQNKHAYPDRFTGLIPFSECLDYYQYCQADKVCVIPGTYTFTTFGGTNYVNNPDRPSFKFETLTTNHYSPQTAQNMGSILDSAVSARTSDLDYFSCKDNAVTINGYVPCTISGGPATKAIYRQFYLKTDAIVAINGAYNCGVYGGSKTLFSGKATDGLAGLQPLAAPWRCFGNAQSPACIPLPAGWYTVVSYGAGPGYQNPLQNLNINSVYSSYVGQSDRFSITVTPACLGPKYNRPYKAAIDTITHQPYLVDWPSRFTNTPYINLYAENFNCTIDTPFATGRPTCVAASYNRVTYYVFRVAKATAIQFSSTSGYNSIFSVYPGDVRMDSVQMRTATPLIACANLYSAAQVCNVQPGTYTLIVYSDNNNSCNYILPVLSKPCNEPLYNRPYKAAIDTITHQPFVVDWGPRVGHTTAYPKTDTTYTLYREYFNCQTDTPFLSHPIPSCNTAVSRVAYYVFKTLRESYVQINTQGLWGAVYARDVRTDSSSLPTTAPVQPCLQSAGFIQLCRLPQGTYTLVIFSPGNATNCTSVVPAIYIDQPGYSRFDHAAQAYDFGTVPPDSAWHNGKVGDVNPLNSGRAPSNDFFYCTTGARPTDPADPVCSTVYVPNIYNDTLKYAFNSTTYTGSSVRRNLWYTFVTDQGGTVRVKVNNKTIGKQYQYRFAVYKSNVAGNLPFSTVVSSGQVDSTLAQGLSFVVTNPSYYYCYSANPEVTFYRDPCNNMAERYYILVENTNTYPVDNSGMQPNSQAEVSILIDSVSSIAPRFDHYSQAGSIPALGTGTFTGPTDNFSCATRDVPDPVYASLTSCTKNLWYKFTTTLTGNIQFRVMIGTSSYYDYQNIQLFRQVIPGDSTATGLQYMSYTNTVYDAGNYWGQTCITPGTYYLLLPGCNRVSEYVYPQIKITEQAGDFCSAPVVAPISGTGTATATVTVNCHTIGTDYGEFNPTLTCPANTPTSTYKSSWFRVDITGTDTLDITAFLNENTSASSSQIKYRMMTGSCGAMQEQSCVQDALTQNTYKCLTPGSYYFQVFTPVAATGTIDLKLTAIHHADTCAPINNCLANANFTPLFDCTTGDSVRFVNYSTYGSAIQYTWNFGYNGQTSTAVSPSFFYPALATSANYTVSLTASNTSCNGQGSVNQQITIPARPYINLGRDTALCNGGSIILNATSHPGSTYLWSTGAITPTITVSSTAAAGTNYWVRVTYNGCIKRDTIKVFINPITGRNQNKIFCGSDSVQLSSSRGYGETYLWNTGATASYIYASTGGAYYCDITLNGCTKRDTFNITGANFNFGNDTAICIRPGFPYILSASTPGAISYLWQNNSTAATFSVTTPGQYWVRINFGTCTVQDTINISNIQPVTRNVAAVLCAGQSYTLPSGVTVNTGGIYKDTLRTVRGCDSIITSTALTLKPVTNQIIAAAICQGRSYMLPGGAVVTAAGVFRDTLRSPTDGCDSIIRTIILSVRNVRVVTTATSICSGQNYTLPSGTVVTTAGTYKDTIRYVGGCDSLITNVTLSVGVPTRVNRIVSVCAGQNYTLPSGTIVSTNGIYTDTLHSIYGCDSLIITVNLTVKTTTVRTTNISICTGQNYNLPSGTVVNTPGTYLDTVRYANSTCDSLHTTVNLAVTPVLRTNVSTLICAGQSYVLPSGIVVNTAGTYSDTIHTVSGCDSLVTIATVGVRTAIFNSLSESVCAGQLYTLPSGMVVATAGTYNDTLRYTAGCDSVVTTVNLTLKTARSIVLNPAVCAGQTYTLPNGTNIATAGTYYDTLHYAGGCDSVHMTISLTVATVDTASISAGICAGATYTLPSGTVVNTSGVYYDTLRHTSGGCDSMRYRIRVLVTPVASSAVAATLCAGQSYTLPSGMVVNIAGTYRDTIRTASGCDSLVTTATIQLRPVLRTNTTASLCAGQTYLLPSGMIVNTSGVYADTIRYIAGCDSLITNINLTIKPIQAITQDASVCAGQYFTLANGMVVNTAGTYYDTLHYSGGCDSIRRTIVLTVGTVGTTTINAAVCTGVSYTLPSGTVVNNIGIYYDTVRHVAGGCDSVRYTINLTARPVLTATGSAAICQGQTYTLPSGTVVNAAGVYRDTIRYVAGCDSLIKTITVTASPVINRNTANTICAGDSYMLPSGAVVGTAGTYRDTIRYAGGCDSLITVVNLAVRPVRSTALSPVICAGQNYTLPSGIVVNTAGTYRDTLRYSSAGCDSIRYNVNLTIKPLARITTTASICAGQNYILPSGAIISAAGTYHDTLHYGGGCDSVITTLALSIKPVSRLNTPVTICAGQSYTLPSGTVVTGSGTYADTLHYVAGCDSLITTVNLLVRNVVRRTAPAIICSGQSYILPSGTVVNTSGNYADTLRYANPVCDSVITTVNLIVKPLLRRSSTASVCSGQAYTLPSGGTITASGTYQDTVRYVAGCDSLISTITIAVKPLVRRTVPTVICQGSSYTLPSGTVVGIAGTYADTLHYVAGCDSVITTVNLSVRSITRSALPASICAGQHYTLPSGVILNTSGTYADTLRYANSVCDSMITTVTLTVKPLLRITNAASVCQGSGYTLPSGAVINTAGTYSDTVRYVSGCDSLITNVTLAVKAVTRRTTTAAACQGQSYTLPSGMVVTMAGTYADTLHYVGGCDSIINTFTLRINTVTTTNAAASICQGLTYTLPWGAMVTTAGTYRDTLRYTTGCDSLIRLVTLAVTPRTPMGISPPSISVCEGDSLKLNAFGGTNYQWIQGGGVLSPASASTYIYPPSAGAYRVAIFDPLCNITDTFQSIVSIDLLPQITITKTNDVNCIQGSAQLVANGGNRYRWSPPAGLSNATISNPLVAPVQTTVYHVRATSDKNCTAEDSIEVRVVKGDAGLGYYVPSAFSPDGDGKNDCFGVRNWGAVKDVRFNVYDRWGLLVFTTTDPTKCWDGTYKGEKLAPAAFIYIISANTICGPVNRKGTVVLVR